MIKKRLSSKGWDNFILEHASNITDVRTDRIYLKCILPGHRDTHRSAVLYKSGVYACPVCGNFSLGLDNEIVERKEIAVAKQELWFPCDQYPQHYYEMGSVISAANVVNGKIVGLTTRLPWGNHRRYLCTGEPGFRLFAPVITESLTDAITLLKLGINAGSICSVANWKKIPQSCLYVPQNDTAGLNVVWKLKNTAIWKWFWKIPNHKDITEISTDILELLVSELKPAYSIEIPQETLLHSRL